MGVSFLQGPMSVRSWKYSVSKQIKKNSRHSAIQESVHCTLRKATSRFHFKFLVEKVRLDCFPTIFDPTKSTNTVSSRLKSLADRKRQCDEQPQAKKVCPEKLDFEDSKEACADFRPDATSVHHDHSYFCSQEQATPKSNTNCSDTTLPKGQTDLTVDEI